MVFPAETPWPGPEITVDPGSLAWESVHGEAHEDHQVLWEGSGADCDLCI